MSGFDADWLRQREPFDLAARDDGLAAQLASTLADRARAPLRLLDLAAGSGANFRVLAPLLGGDQDWLLVDHDPLLLAAQHSEITRWARAQGWRCRELEGGLAVDTGVARWQVRGLRLDLSRSLEQLDPAAFDAVTTTAFLDLVSADWLDRLCRLLARGSLPLLATLTVDGRRDWTPPLPLDGRLLDAFWQHQSGDKGFGPSLGNHAATCLADALPAYGYAVSTARSDWRIGPEHPAMLRRMVDEAASVATAAGETTPAGAALLNGWQAERVAQIESGRLSLDIGHVDLLALPPANRGSARTPSR